MSSNVPSALGNQPLSMDKESRTRTSGSARSQRQYSVPCARQTLTALHSSNEVKTTTTSDDRIAEDQLDSLRDRRRLSFDSALMSAALWKPNNDQLVSSCLMSRLDLSFWRRSQHGELEYSSRYTSAMSPFPTTEGVKKMDCRMSQRKTHISRRVLMSSLHFRRWE